MAATVAGAHTRKMIGAPMPYGYSDTDWNAAHREITELLEEHVERSRLGEYISYGDLAKRVKAIQFGPHDAAFHKMLGAVSVAAQEGSQDAPLLTVVVGTAGSGMPGKGFFDLARELRGVLPDEDKFWSDEIKAVWGRWGKHWRRP